MATASDPTALEFPDEVQYWHMARSLWNGDGLRDELGFQATRMPLYPAVLSVFTTVAKGVMAARGFQWLIGAAVAVAVGALGSAVFGRRTGLVAGIIAAFDPFLVFLSSLLLTETLFLLFLVMLFWLVVPLLSGSGAPYARTNLAPGSLWRWAAVGLCAAVCTYARESSLGLFLLLCIFLMTMQRFNGRATLGVVIACLIVVAALFPWAARNRRVTGEWCWLTTRGGISLYDGVGPQATGASDLGNIKQMPAVRGLSETEWNRYFVNGALTAMKADPSRLIRLAGVKLARLWNPFPNVETYQSRLVRWCSAGWMLPLVGLAALGLALCNGRDGYSSARKALFLLLPAVYLSALHSLFVGSVRYRLGAMPMLEILAAVALLELWNRRMRQRSGSRSGIRESPVADR